MIYTVILNPSIDFTAHVDHLQIGDLNRMTNDFRLPGGKEISVSRILRHMETESTALGSLGGFTSSFIANWLREEKIQTNFTPAPADTRINIKSKSDTETEINGLGPTLTNEEIRELEQAASRIQVGDIVVLSGSTPASLRRRFYEELVQIAKEKGAEFIINATSEDLMNALSQKPLLIKPSDHELAELYHTTFTSAEDILPYGHRLLEEGARHITISMADDDALFFTTESAYRSNVLKRPLKSSVSTGDSMIVGFIGNFSKTQDPLEAFKWGIAYSSATAFSDDLASEDFIQELIHEVTIEKVSE